MTRVLLIDNYDSFTFNLVQFLGDLQASAEVWRNDRLSAAEALDRGAQAIVLSPGPCDPDKAGICLELIAANMARGAAALPLLGVCLGHQALGQAAGGRVVRAPTPMHGKLSPIHHNGQGILAGLPSPFRATRYHSLVVERTGLPDCLVVDGQTEDGLIMAMHHRSLPLWGVQFHPESIASEHGHAILANFLALARPGRQAA